MNLATNVSVVYDKYLANSRSREPQLPLPQGGGYRWDKSIENDRP